MLHTEKNRDETGGIHITYPAAVQHNNKRLSLRNRPTFSGYTSQTMMSMQNLEDIIALPIKISYPLLLIFGTFGSIIIIIVFQRLKDYSAMSIYYITLALSDLMSLYFGWVTYFWMGYQLNVAIICWHTIVCKLTVFVAYISSAASSWYLVAMTMQKAMSVVFPHRVNVVCTRTMSSLVTVCITLVIMASYSHVLLGYSMEPCNSTFCKVCTCGPANADYMYFYNLVWPWIDLMIASLIPFVLLAVSNAVLIRKVLTSVREARHRLAVGQSMHVTAREKKASSMTVTLIALSVTFFVLTGPVRVHFIVYPHVILQAVDISVDQLIFCVLLTLYGVHCGVNFYLYCLTGAKFRQEVVRLLLGFFHFINSNDLFKKLLTLNLIIN